MNPNAQENWDHQVEEIIQGHVQNMVGDFRRMFEELATTPTPENEGTGMDGEALTHLKESVDAIHAASGQREMAQRLLDAAGRQASRAAILLVRGDDCVGFQATGFPTQDNFADRPFAPTEDDPLFHAITRQETQQLPGPALESSVLRGWIQEAPTHICLAPIVVADRTVGIIYADSGTGGSIRAEAVDILACVAAMYLDRLRHREAQVQEDRPVTTQASTDATQTPAMSTLGAGTHSLAVGADTDTEDTETDTTDLGTPMADSGAHAVDMGTTDTETDITDMDTPVADTDTHAIGMGATDTEADTTELDTPAAGPGTHAVDMGAPTADTGTHAIDMGMPGDTDTADWQPEVPAVTSVDLDGTDSSQSLAPTPEAAPSVEPIPVEPMPPEKPEALPISEPDTSTGSQPTDPMPPVAASPDIERGEGVPQPFDPSATMVIPVSPEPVPATPPQQTADLDMPAPQGTPDLGAPTQMDTATLQPEATPDFGSTMQMEIPPELRQNEPPAMPTVEPTAPPATPTEPAPQAAGTSAISEDARRFARLLVSEIVLYNEAAVQTGQKKGDLYKRLQVSIDRSREAYTERFDASQAAGFEEELIKTLAMGNRELMGSDYTSA